MPYHLSVLTGEHLTKHFTIHVIFIFIFAEIRTQSLEEAQSTFSTYRIVAVGRPLGRSAEILDGSKNINNRSQNSPQAGRIIIKLTTASLIFCPAPGPVKPPCKLNS